MEISNAVLQNMVDAVYARLRELAPRASWFLMGIQGDDPKILVYCTTETRSIELTINSAGLQEFFGRYVHSARVDLLEGGEKRIAEIAGVMPEIKPGDIVELEPGFESLAVRPAAGRITETVTAGEDLRPGDLVKRDAAGKAIRVDHQAGEKPEP
jgi:hypothetical protein